MNPPPTPIDADVMERTVRLYKLGKFPEAESLYRRVIGRNPDYPDALHLLGVLAHRSGNNEAAAGLISRAIALRSSDPAFHSNLDAALMAQGKTAEAAECQKRTIRLKPDYPEAYGKPGGRPEGGGTVGGGPGGVGAAPSGSCPNSQRPTSTWGWCEWRAESSRGRPEVSGMPSGSCPDMSRRTTTSASPFNMLGRFAGVAGACRRSVARARVKKSPGPAWPGSPAGELGPCGGRGQPSPARLL